ncbi:MAG: hypothetical protein GX876_02810, partial [Bacteroidales bacterium]|nr:hypothetical protein [Bacteroidales bacterium]
MNTIRFFRKVIRPESPVSFSLLLIICLSILFSGCSDMKPGDDFDPVELVSPLMGTDSEFRLSNGNTYPAIALP